MLKVFLTGGIASGKTLVSDFFAGLGIPVIDTDIISRELVNIGEPALDEISTKFGSDTLNPDGSLNRSALRNLIFNDPDKKKQLENILHPRIYVEVENRLKNLDAPYAIVVVPLLLETGKTQLADHILLVDTPLENQLSRVMRRDHINRKQAELILQAQSTREQRRSIADDVILNDGNIAELEPQISELHTKYLKMAQQN